MVVLFSDFFYRSWRFCTDYRALINKNKPSFQVSQLKRALSTEERTLQVEPGEVLNVHKLLNETRQMLIKWANLPDCKNTWEGYELIDNIFLKFHLGNKVKLIRGSIDRP